MSNFGTGSTGNEDLVFSLGLDGITLVDNLDATEQKVSDSLGKIGKSFQNLKTVVDDAGKNNQFKTNLTETSKTANSLTAQLRALLTALRDVNAELAKTRSSSSATGALQAQLATVAKLQAAVANLQAQTFNTGSKIGLAAANAVKNLSSVATQATNAAGKVQNLGQNANATGNSLSNMGAKGAAATKQIGLSGQTLNQTFQQAGGVLRNISTVLSTIGLGGGIFALIYGFKQLVKDGIDFNSQVEQAKISLAAEVVASAKMVEVDGQRVEGLRAIHAVQGQVGGLVNQLKLDALFVNGTFEDMLGITQSIAPQILRMGGNLEQVHRIAQLTGIAASVLNVEFKTAQTGLSQLLNGNVVGRNMFVRRLPIPVDELKAGLKDVNGRADYLISVLQKLEDAGPLIMTSFKGAFTTMKDLLQQITGAAMQPLESRLQAGFNSFVSANVKKGSDGTIGFSPELESTITRVSRLVDTLLGQVTMVARELFNTGGRSFLDTAEEILPRIVSGLGNLISFLAQIGGFLADHAGLVLKLVGYYMTFNIVVGVFNSLWGVVTKINGAIMALQGVMLQAGSSTLTFSGAVGMLTGALQALATKAVIALLVVAVMEMVSHFLDARQAAADMKLALDDLNHLNFDSAISQIRKLTQEIKDGEGWWDKLWSLGKTKQNAGDINKLTESAVNKSFDILSSLGVNASSVHFYGVPVNPSTGKPEVHDTGLDPTEILGSARKIGEGIEVIRKQQDALQQEARTASDKRREDIKTELGDLAKKNEALKSTLSLLKENTLAAQALGSTEEGRKQLGSTKIALYGKAGEDVAAVEAGLNMAPRTVVTPNTTETPEDQAAAQRLLRNESALVNALEQVSQASSRVLDRNNQRQQSEMDLLVAKHVITVQQAAAREIQIAKDTAAAKIGVQEKLFQKLSDNKLVDLSGAKEALGLGKGTLTFTDLQGVSEEQVAQAMADMQSKAETANKTDQSKFQKKIHDLEILGKIVSAVHTEQEKLGSTIADNNRRSEKADEDAINSGKEQAAQISERNAQLDMEQSKLFDIATTVDERIAREKKLTAEIVKQGKAAVDQKTQKEIDTNNAKTDWTPEQKATANAAITATADREKAYLDAKEQIALAQRIVDIKDQEITLGQTGTQIREIELGTMKQLLGAENPLVVTKQNELTLEKAKTLELQAQARYAAAAELTANGQNTAAREATKAGDILMAQAAALRMETANYFQVIGSGLSQFADFLGRFSGTLGTAATGLSKLFGGIGNLSKLDLGNVYTTAKGSSTGILGVVQGASAAAGPIAAVASEALGLFQGFFNIFEDGWKKLLSDAHDKVQAALDTTLGDLRLGKSTLQQTIDDLKNQAAHVSDKYPAAKGGAPWYSWLMPVVGASISIYNGLSDKARQDAIDQDTLAIGKQIEQMAQDAQDAIYKLENVTLPALRVTPAMREFQSSIETIRTELQQLAGTPGITQSDLNEMFNLRIADLQSSAMDTLLSQQQEYYDILKQEKDLKKQLADLDDQQAQVEKDYADQRAQILGLASRQLSKEEQLAQLKTDEQKKLDDIAQQKKDLQDQLDYVEKQKSVYEEVFGVVQDMGKYESDIQDQLLAKTQTRLESLQTFLKEIQDWMNSGVWGFITNNGQTTANGNPYALPVVLTNPTAITNPEPSNPGTSVGGDQINYNMNGDIYVSGNMTQAEAKQSFLDAWRAFNSDNAVKGLAYSNG